MPSAIALHAGNLAGQAVQFRWRQVTTSGLTTPRWHVDDVRLGVVMDTTLPDPFGIVSCVSQSGMLELTWRSTESQTYSVETSPVIEGGVWTPVEPPTPGTPGGGTTKVILDVTRLPGHPHRELFFRIVSRPSPVGPG